MTETPWYSCDVTTIRSRLISTITKPLCISYRYIDTDLIMMLWFTNFSIFPGQLAVLLKHIDVPGGVYAPDDVVGQIKTLQEKADHISSLATANVQQTQGDYYKRKSSHTAHIKRYARLWCVLLWFGIGRFIQGPLLLTWFDFHPSMDKWARTVKCGVKSFIHSQTSTVLPLKFGNGYVISPTPYNGCN